MAEEEKLAIEPEEPDIENLKQSLAEEKEKAQRYLSNWQRAEADFSNYRKRTEQEKNGMFDLATTAFMRNLLPVIDDLERAFASVPPRLSKLIWIDGVRLIQRKLEAFVEAQGLTKIEALGQPFDPNLHDAVAYQEGDEGMVIAEVQKGYKLKDKVLRPTLVVVGNGAHKGKMEEAGETT